RQQLAIPIKGEELANLKRAEGVQKWYESQVVNTAKKIAKQNGMDFELKTEGKGAGILAKDLFEAATDFKANIEQGVDSVKAFKVALKHLEASGMDKADAKVFLDNVRDGKPVGDLVNKSGAVTEFTGEEVKDLNDNFRRELRVYGMDDAIEMLEDNIHTRLGNAFEGNIEAIAVAVRRGNYGEANKLIGGNPGTTYAIIKPKGEASTRRVATVEELKELTDLNTIMSSGLGRGLNPAEIARMTEL
ncbi:MAG: hypothetical protein GY914_01405, partial [Prochlorococcus sp.]|nr:hypothetical protein [Prochlorococcus sp.]